MNVEIDLENAPITVESLRTYGAEFGTGIKSVYDKMNALRENWTGKRYDELIEHFNNNIQLFNATRELVEIAIPDAIAVQVGNYQMFEHSEDVVKKSDGKAEEIVTMDLTNTQMLTCDTDRVGSVKQEVFDAFDTIAGEGNGVIKKINDTFNNLKWTGPAHDQFKDQLETKSTEVVNALQTLSSDFDKLFELAVSDMEAAENANMGNGGVSDR